MSMDRCGRCDRLVDTDEDCGFYVGAKDRPICEPCRDELVMCPACDGDGFIDAYPYTIGLKCTACNGEGLTEGSLEENGT